MCIRDRIWLDQHVPITIQGTDTLSGIYEVRIYTKQHHLLKKQQWDDERKEEFHMKVSTSDIPLQLSLIHISKKPYNLFTNSYVP